jgi:DNA-binding GntR family transcriptional regulator
LTEAKAAQTHFSLYRFYEDACLRIDYDFESLAARKATPSEQKCMRLDADGIVIVVMRHSFRADGRLLDAVDAVHDSRRYVYQALLQRDPDRALRSVSNEVGDKKDA